MGGVGFVDAVLDFVDKIVRVSALKIVGDSRTIFHIPKPKPRPEFPGAGKVLNNYPKITSTGHPLGKVGGRPRYFVPEWSIAVDRETNRIHISAPSKPPDVFCTVG